MTMLWIGRGEDVPAVWIDDGETSAVAQAADGTYAVFTRPSRFSLPPALASSPPVAAARAGEAARRQGAQAVRNEDRRLTLQEMRDIVEDQPDVDPTDPCEMPSGLRYLPGCECATCTARRAAGMIFEITQEPAS